MRRLHLYSSAVLILLLPTRDLSGSEVRGVIIKADDKAHEVTLEARSKGMRGAVLKFVTNADTQVRIGKQPAGFADLTPGKRVRVVFEEREGRLVAYTIQIVSLPLLMPPGGPPFGVPPGPGANPPISNDPNAISGLLRRISVTEGEIVVVAAAGGGENEMVLTVADNARILRDGKPIRLEDLKENEPVVIREDKKDNKLVARSIEAGTATGLAPPPAPQDENRIQKVRRILQTIDGFLEMVGKQPPP
jgi:hypothetical protein